MVAALGTVLGVSVPANALNGSDFQPGRIISDSVFYNSSSMSPQAVQNFLSAQVPNCRAGYTCLKDYWQATGSIAADRYCRGYQGVPTESAASIIAKVAASCGINPQVILVTLQKEQSLVTDTWPSQTQYDKATGFSCPDTAPCDPKFAGFAYQVYYGARIFQVYAQNNSSFNYHPGQNNTILYNPNRACGSQTVFIQNQATANLYIYTPYVPNAAALANLYGTGDSCSAYGNRNFWRIFSDWFGSTITGIDSKDATSLIYALYNDILGRNPDQGGVNTWHNYLIGQGWPTISVANGILYSKEYFLARINAAYKNVLGRDPDPAGQADWLNRMIAGTASVDDITLSFTQSLEYYNKAGGSDQAFVTNLYQTMLGRAPSQAELDYWSGVARQYGSGAVIGPIYNSYESGTRRLNAIYKTYLKRDVDPSGISSWVPVILSQGDQGVRTVIVSSLEYLLQARQRFPQPS